MNIKTITTTAGMNTVVFGNSPDIYYWVKNIGTTDITAGATDNAENHAIVKPDCAVRVDTMYDTVYINGAGTVEIYETDTPEPPFMTKRKGGDNTEYGENIFDFNVFRTKLSALSQPVMNGTVTWLDNGFTLTASSADCYTWFADGTAPYFDVEKNTAYEISCDVSGDTGHIYIFFDYPPVGEPFIYYKNTNTKFTFTTLSSTQKITLRFGVQGTGSSCTYSNIKIRQIL